MCPRSSTKDKNKFIHFRVSDFDYVYLSEVSKHYNLTVSQFCRQIITMYLSERRIIENADKQTTVND